VIIPAYNAADTIDQALRSLDAQGGVAWEAIVVDDGSTDDTAEIVQRRTRRDSRVKLIRQRQSGVSAARNAGVAVARGEWLCFLDADDWLAPRAFARLLALARSDPEADVLVGGATRVGEMGGLWDYDSRDLSDPFTVLSTHCSIAIHSALARRTAVRDLGGFDESLRSSEDWDLWQRLARAGGRFAQTPARVAFYRARLGSLSRDLRHAAEAGLAVMRRGHAPDPRVARPLPRHQNGAPADDLPMHEFYYLLWCAARDIAVGGDGLATAAPLRQGHDVDFSPSAIGGLMASGVADALACRLDRLGPCWEGLAPRLAALLEFVCPEDDRRRLRQLALGVIRSLLNSDGTDQADVLRLEAPVLPRLEPARGDFAVLQLRSGGVTAGPIALPVLAERDGVDLVDAIARQAGRIPLKKALEAVRPWRSLGFWKAVAPVLLDLRGSGLRAALRRPHQAAPLLRSRLRRAVSIGLEGAVRARLEPLAKDSGPSAHAEAVCALRAEVRAELGATNGPPSAPVRPEARAERDAADTAQAGAWDAFFAADDPWNYGASDYERLKYRDTLELIPDLPDGSALELACAQGHFAAQLAPRVGALLATDISQKALERAAERCAGLGNVAFQALDFARRPLPGRYDLIVCSEALYYLSTPLATVARRLAAGLKPGGLLVMAHANQICDEPEATGFDWGRAFGARTIGEVFSAHPALALEREIRRPLYRVQAFRRVDGDRAPSPVIEERGLDVRLDPAVARDVVWGGGESRIAAFHREVAARAPILMYHRVAPDGAGPAALDRWRVTPEAFEAQIAFLRRRGYWGVGPDELAAAMASGKPLPGRPVMITFDDGYQDFAEHAWPVLQKHDFAATVFVVPAKVGGVADWDERFGAAAQLMDWDRIAELAAAGVSIESHGLSHSPLSRLSVREVYRELLTSQARIEAATGRAPISVCYPYGAADRVVERIAEECGLKLGFGVMPNVADLSDDPFRLPRIEVSGFDDLASFGRKLGLG
jgi:peptidoglycan/xylan/chitin deacetylase (PgdA/CDA1 family)/2-polyprenyl-3-methyl-5-hydroxy-6-metoxy-1,4-benzoquinol methylase